MMSFSSSPQYCDAIEINNLAVQNLEYNNISSACKLLIPAVKTILSNYSSSTTTATTTTNVSYATADSWKYTNFKWSKSIPSHATKKSTTTTTNNTTTIVGSSFIFSRAMYIQDLRPVRHALPAQVVSSDIKAAIIYNAGLAYHLCAMKKKNNHHASSSLMTKARDMYRLSQAILRDANQKKKKKKKMEEKTKSSSSSSSSYSSKLLHKHFFHVALLNNMGQICYELLEYPESQHYFQNVEANLLHIISKESRKKKKQQQKTNPTTSSSRKDRPLFDPNDVLGMMTNSLVDIPTAAPCA